MSPCNRALAAWIGLPITAAVAWRPRSVSTVRRRAAEFGILMCRVRFHTASAECSSTGRPRKMPKAVRGHARKPMPYLLGRNVITTRGGTFPEASRGSRAVLISAAETAASHSGRPLDFVRICSVMRPSHPRRTSNSAAGFPSTFSLLENRMFGRTAATTLSTHSGVGRAVRTASILFMGCGWDASSTSRDCPYASKQHAPAMATMTRERGALFI